MTARYFSILLILPLAANCASIFSTSKYTIQTESSPSGARVELRSKSGKVFRKLKAPGKFDIDYGRLSSPSESLYVVFTLPGREPERFRLQAEVDGSTFGNLVLGPLAIFTIPYDLFVTKAGWKPKRKYYYAEFVKGRRGTSTARRDRRESIPTRPDPNYPETVYLKNGRVYRNVRTRFRPNHVVLYKKGGGSIVIAKSKIRKIQK